MIRVEAFNKESVWTAIAQLVLFIWAISFIIGNPIPSWIAIIAFGIGSISTIIFLFNKIIKGR